MGRFNQEFMFVYRMYVCIHDAMMHFFGSHIWCKPQSNLIVHIVSSWGTNVIALPNRSQNFDSDIVLLPCFCCASAILLSNRSTTYELCLNLHILFFCSAPWLVTCDIRLYCFCHRFYDWPFEECLCETLITVPCYGSLSRTSCIFWAGCWLYYWLLADRGAVSSREMIGFVWLMLVVLLIVRWSWSSFVQGNDWFCLIDISSSMPVYSVLIAHTLCWFHQR